MAMLKYVPPERIDILQNMRIRFTPPKYFNDPFDLSPHVDFSKGLKEQLLEDPTLFEDELKKQYDALPVKQRKAIPKKKFLAMFLSNKEAILSAAADEFAPSVKQIGEDIFANLREKIGVLSLSEVSNSILMWAHYADANRGFVIEFDENHDFFHQRKGPSDEFRHLRQVLYSSARPEISAVKANAVDFFLTKSNDWNYEKEWRMFLPLEDANEVREETIHLFNLPPQCITGVIMGCKMETEIQETILTVLKSQQSYTHIRIGRAMPDEKRFRFNLTYKS